MRIYADLRCLQDPEYAFRGIGRHCVALLRSVRQTMPEPLEVVGILDDQMPALPEEYRGLVDVRQSCLTPQPRRQPDVFFQPSPMTHDPSPLAPLLGQPRLRSCAFVYDFIPLDRQECYLPTLERRRGYFNNLFWLKYYQTFCVLSRHTARRLQEILGVPGPAMEVVGGAIRDVFFRFDPRAAAGQLLPCRYAPNRYFVAPGGHDRRKNVEAAIVAHARLIGRTRCAHGLVIVGHYLEDYQAQLGNLFREHGGPPGQLEFVSEISDEQLACLYHHALATVCASRAEGFSLPVVEAIASGCPVLAASCEAQRELVEQEDALFDPDDTERLAAVMERLLHEPCLRAGLLEQQRPVAPRFAEQEVAGRFWRRVLRDVRPTPVERGVTSPSSKPRLAFLSPYPPDRSGVADYTAHSLQSLSKYATIDVYTDAQGVQESPWIRRFAPLTEAPYVVNEYDRVVAVVGNSDFHKRIIDYHCRYGGACLAHDNRLAELYYFWRGPQKFVAMASRSLGRPVSVEEAQSWLYNASELPWTFFDEILAKADPLIFHSRGIQAHVAEAYGKKTRHLPFCCYRHFTDEELSEGSRQDARRRLRLPPDRVAVVTLGFISPHKAPLECLWALEHLRAWGVPADLYFVGSDQHFKGPLVEWTERLQLGEYVHVLGDWVSDQVYRDFVLAADFGIQLRTHGFGGLSGAVLDCISAGLPTVINRDMAEATEGPSYVLRVPDHLSPTLIAEQLVNAYEAGLHRTRVGAAREAYVREHSFDNYAVQMMQVLGLS
jgi:glycosyltransferase involved in cell wall biosynthesis